MVSLKDIEESNTVLRGSHGPDKVALFVGATSGLAFHTMLEYARKTERPKVYVVGRGEAKLAAVLDELRNVNAGGTYVPIKAEISLLKNIDTACVEFQRQEKRLDLLVMCPGYLKLSRVDNADGLEDTISLRYYGRARFIHNLLPELSARPSSRILSIHAGTRENTMVEDDLELKHNYSIRNAAVHTATMNSMFMQEVASRYPTISCVHVFPGVVITPSYTILAEDWYFPLRYFFTYIMVPIAKLFTLSLPESGQRHLFHATSARYPPAAINGAPAAGSSLPEGVSIAKGADGTEGSGFYSIGWDGEPGGDRAIMDAFLKRDMPKTIWDHTLSIFKRVLGSDQPARA